jgi:hypothetical protein
MTPNICFRPPQHFHAAYNENSHKPLALAFQHANRFGMKIYAFINWKEGFPAITAAGFGTNAEESTALPLVGLNKSLLEQVWALFRPHWPKDVRIELMEFESVESMNERVN